MHHTTPHQEDPIDPAMAMEEDLHPLEIIEIERIEMIIFENGATMTDDHRLLHCRQVLICDDDREMTDCHHLVLVRGTMIVDEMDI
jgi:hypothetical protein